MDDLELAALTFIARHSTPAYQPKPRELAPKTTIDAVQQNNYSNAQYSAGTQTDEALGDDRRLLLKMGVPQALLEEAQTPPYRRRGAGSAVT